MSSPQIIIRPDLSGNTRDSYSPKSLISFAKTIDRKKEPCIKTDVAKPNEFITRQEFEKIFEFFYSNILILSENNERLKRENEDYCRRLLYLEGIVKKTFFEVSERKSHENTTQLRDALKLPHIEEKISENIIDDLDGLLEDLPTEKKNAIELLHEVRGE